LIVGWNGWMMNKWSQLPPLEELVNDISFQGRSQDFDFGEHDFKEWLVMCLLLRQSPCKYAATRKLVFEASLKSWHKAIWTCVFLHHRQTKQWIGDVCFLTPLPNQAVNWCMFGISQQSTVHLVGSLDVHLQLHHYVSGQFELDYVLKVLPWLNWN